MNYLKLDTSKYTLDGKYTKLAMTLNPYTGAPTLNEVRDLSDKYSHALASSKIGYSFRQIAAMILNLTDGRDFYTGERIMTDEEFLVLVEKIHRDHLIAAAKGGLYFRGNVVITLEGANIEKSDMDPYDYYDSRFDRGLPTLFETKDEAHNAITFLLSLYATSLPNAKRFADNFNQLKFPLTYMESYVAFSGLVSDYPDLKFITRGRQLIAFDITLQNTEFWESFNNKDAEVFLTLPEATVERTLGRNIIKIANVFAHNDLDIMDLSHDEIWHYVGEYTENLSPPVASELRLTTRALIRQLGILCGDIDVDGTVLNGTYPDVLIQSALEFDESLLSTDAWLELNNPELKQYSSYSPLTIKDIIGSRMVTLANLFAEKKVDLMTATDDQVNEIVAELTEDKTSNERSKYRLAGRMVIKYKNEH